MVAEGLCHLKMGDGFYLAQEKGQMKKYAKQKEKETNVSWLFTGLTPCPELFQYKAVQ